MNRELTAEPPPLTLPRSTGRGDETSAAECVTHPCPGSDALQLRFLAAHHCSLMVMRVIFAGFLGRSLLSRGRFTILSTVSMPEVTLPKAVY